MAPPITVDIMGFSFGPSEYAGRFAGKNIRVATAQQGVVAASQPPAQSASQPKRKQVRFPSDVLSANHI
jgi:hypothetical protein